MNTEVYFRKCDNCGKGMNEGFVINGVQTVCSEACRRKFITDEDYDNNSQYDESDTYWTEWEDIDYDGAPTYTAEGETNEQ